MNEERKLARQAVQESLKSRGLSTRLPPDLQAALEDLVMGWIEREYAVLLCYPEPAAFCPGGDLEDVGDAVAVVCRSLLQGSQVVRPSRVPATPPVQSEELWHYLPERVQQEMKAHMDTVLPLIGEAFPPLFPDEDSAKRYLQEHASEVEVERYPSGANTTVWVANFGLGFSFPVRFGDEVWTCRIFDERFVGIPLLEYAMLAEGVARYAWVNRADATAFLLYGYHPPHPSALRTSDGLFVDITLPAWLSHDAVRAVWRAVHVNLHQSSATHYVAHLLQQADWVKQARKPLRGEQWRRWWNAHAPSTWALGTVQACTTALYRARQALRRLLQNRL